MPQSLVREYTDADVYAVKTLMHELGYDLSINDVINNVHHVQQHGGTIFLAQSDDTIVGCICAMIDARLAEGLYGEIVSLVVTEKFRGHGIGKKLVSRAEILLKERVNTIRVRANTVRSSAHRFYESLGYQSVKNQKIFIKAV